MAARPLHPGASHAHGHVVPCPPLALRRRWDSWARLFEPLLASVPAIYIGGNHEVEHQPNNATFAAFNARYPQPKASTAPRCFCGLPCHQPRPRQPRHRPPVGMAVPGAISAGRHASRHRWLLPSQKSAGLAAPRPVCSSAAGPLYNQHHPQQCLPLPQRLQPPPVRQHLRLWVQPAASAPALRLHRACQPPC